MTKQTGVVDTKPEHKNGHKPEPAILPGPVSEFAGVVELGGAVLGANGNGNVESQASRLNDVRLQTVQRQGIAKHIVQMQGNHHLQRVIQTARNSKSTAPRSRGSDNVAEIADVGETEGFGSGGSLLFTGAGLPPNGNGKNTHTDHPLIQREDDDDRPTEEERALALAKAKVAEQAAKQTKSENQQETVKSKKAGAAEAEAGKTAKSKKEQAATAAKSLKDKKKQAAESADEQDGAPAAKGKGTGMQAAEAAQPIAAPPAGPQDKAPASPEEDPAFQAVVGRVEGTAKKQQAHAPAKAKASQAQAASVPPANETTSKAQSNQVGAMEQAQTPAFNAAAFKAQLMERIAAMSPKNMEEADKFKDQNKMGSVKGEMQSKVSQEKAASQGPLEEKTKAPPDESGIAPKPVTDLQPAQAGAAPGNIGAERAAPKPKGPSEVEQPFHERSQSFEQEMAQENVTDEQLAKSNEPEFQGVLASKQEAQAHSTQAPQEYRAYEGEQVDQAKTEAAGTAQAQLAGMHGDRAQALAKVMGQQTGAKTEDEAARAKVAGDIQQIYDKTKTKVESILAQLDTDVTTTFDTGAQAATQAFEEFVDSKMEAYKEDRYGGWFGWARWLDDKWSGMPAEVNVFYADGRKLFLEKMDAVINNVVQIIGRGLTESKAEVANGRKEIQAYVAQLPADLKKVGKQAASAIQDKFDELESSIDSKQNALVEQLATKYNEKLKAVDARIQELKEANEGLWDKTAGAARRVWAAIKKLKDLILNVLSRIADVVMGIIRDPVGFLGNMIDGIKLGLNNFVSHLPQHLLNALLSWLTGALGPVGIKLPKDILSPEGIFSLVMQILGLTWDAIRAKAVKLLGEPVVKALETGFDIFQALITEGPLGLWKYVQDMFTNIKAMVIDAIINMIKTEVIQAGIKWILGLLTPAGAFIKAAMAIYDIVKFFIEKASQIGDLISAIIDSIAAIAKGGISAAAKLIEDALAKALPLVIGFLASLLSLGDVGKKVQGIIEKIRGKIDKAVDWVIMKAKAVAGKVMGKLGFGKEEKEVGGKKQEKKSPELEAGLGALHAQEQNLAGSDGKLSRTDAEQVAKNVKQTNPIFQSVQVVNGSTKWKYEYRVARAIEPGSVPKEGTDLEPVHVEAVLEAAEAVPAIEQQTVAATPANVTSLTENDPNIKSELIIFWQKQILKKQESKATYEGYIERIKNGEMPTWQQSELEMAFLRGEYAGLGTSQTQAAYKSGQKTGTNVKGSTRPDIADPTQSFIENKKYKIKNLSGLISKVKKQVDDRRRELPAHLASRQGIIVDLRGQEAGVTESLVNDLKQKISQATGLPPANIDVVVW